MATIKTIYEKILEKLLEKENKKLSYYTKDSKGAQEIANILKELDKIYKPTAKDIQLFNTLHKKKTNSIFGGSNNEEMKDDDVDEITNNMSDMTLSNTILRDTDENEDSDYDPDDEWLSELFEEEQELNYATQFVNDIRNSYRGSSLETMYNALEQRVNRPMYFLTFVLLMGYVRLFGIDHMDILNTVYTNSVLFANTTFIGMVLASIYWLGRVAYHRFENIGEYTFNEDTYEFVRNESFTDTLSNMYDDFNNMMNNNNNDKDDKQSGGKKSKRKIIMKRRTLGKKSKKKKTKQTRRKKK